MDPVADPAFITTERWHDISVMLRWLWGYVIFVVGSALSLLLAQAIIPSLVDSGRLPPSFGKLRPAIYLAAFVAVAIASVMFFFVANSSAFLEDIYKRWWI